MRKTVLLLLVLAMPLFSRPYFEARGALQVFYDEIKRGGLQNRQHPYTVRVSLGLKEIAGIFYLYGDIIDDSLQLIPGFGGRLGPLFGIVFTGTDTLTHTNSYVEKYRIGLEGEGIMVGLNVLNKPSSEQDTSGVDNIFTLFGGFSLFTIKPFSLWIGVERIPLKSDYAIKPNTRLYAALNVRF